MDHYEPDLAPAQITNLTLFVRTDLYTDEQGTAIGKYTTTGQTASASFITGLKDPSD